MGRRATGDGRGVTEDRAGRVEADDAVSRQPGRRGTGELRLTAPLMGFLRFTLPDGSAASVGNWIPDASDRATAGNLFNNNK